ncbi:spore coat protein S [Lachnospiraceae bacterium KM106-2]|nr:spore coat protein S [Lachnospiraceae bacterium KM106-2]
MDDKNNEIFRQYELKVFNVYRARGAYVLETNQGLKLLKGFEGSKNHLDYENRIKNVLVERGFQNVDLYVANKSGELISQDSNGGRYIVKDWFVGEECNLRDIGDVKRAIRNLAHLHKPMKHISLSEEEHKHYSQIMLTTIYEKHNRELKRVRTYIKDKKQRNEFEATFLTIFNPFYEQGVRALELIRESDYEELYQKALSEENICHGNYTYHNIVFMKSDEATTNFEKALIGVQVADIYQFLRKTMEKNNWNFEYGNAILEEYSKESPLTKEELKLLYIMLLYPEKFWKVTNYYYNNKKSWISQRNIQKLLGISDQREVKDAYLDHLFKEIQ